MLYAVHLVIGEEEYDLAETFDEAVAEINDALNWEPKSITRALGPQHVPAPV
jgi:hypothetical protein